MNTTVKLCPVCNKENKDNATICRHCGARLGEVSTGFVGIPESSTGPMGSQIESNIDVEAIPEGGIGIQAAGETEPIYMPISWELIIGRKMDAESNKELHSIGKTPEKPDEEALLDLSGMHAGTLGVSRRHAMIRRTVSGYEITDLSSRNGSWLNGERLVPNRPYPLLSGSQLRIGNMQLLIKFKPAKKDQ